VRPFRNCPFLCLDKHSKKKNPELKTFEKTSLKKFPLH
jgi:hypothetical protein